MSVAPISFLTPHHQEPSKLKRWKKGSQSVDFHDPTLFSSRRGSGSFPTSLLDRSERMEQIFHLHTLCRIKNEGGPINRKLMTFAQTISVLSDLKYHSLFGQLITLVDIHLESAIGCIDPHSIDRTTRAIETAFNTHLSGITKSLKARAEQHRVCGIQNYQKVYATQLSVALAMLLVTSAGMLNTKVVPLLRNLFCPSPSLEHEQALDNCLRELESGALTPAFRNFKKPHSPTSKGSRLIRIILRLSPEAEVTHIDAQRAALTGILSHLRQGRVGSCFATQVAVNILATNRSRCLGDFAEMLSDDKLTRVTIKASRAFHFIMVSAGDSLHASLPIDREGRVHCADGTPLPLGALPGIKAACLAIGLHSLKTPLEKILPKLFLKAGTHRRVHLPPKELLQSIFVESQHHTPDFSLANRALMAFDAETENPLQKVWVNAIAGMAEGDENGHLRSALEYAVSTVLGEKIGLFPHKEKILELIKQSLRAQADLLYDPSIPHGMGSEDGHSLFGAFVLYDRAGSRIDQPRHFQNFLLGLIKEVVDLGRESDLLAFFGSEEFLRKVLTNYSETNRSTPLSEWPLMRHTPWVDKTGNVTSHVFRTYYGKAHWTPKEIPSSHLESIIEGIARTVPFVKAASASRICANIPGVHTFSLLPKGVATFADRAWLKRHLVSPGRQLAEKCISLVLREKLTRYMSNQYLSCEQRKAFFELATHLRDGLSIMEFRNALLDLLSSYRKSILDRDRLAKDLDNYLCNEGLSKAEQEELANSMVHFGDTNWGYGMLDVHLAFMINPGNGCLEICEVLENGREMLILDQKNWLNRKWELIGLP